MFAKFEVYIFSHFWAILAFNAQKFTESRHSREPGHAPFLKKIFRGHDGTFRGSMIAKFEVRIFSHSGAINI